MAITVAGFSYPNRIENHFIFESGAGSSNASRNKGSQEIYLWIHTRKRDKS